MSSFSSNFSLDDFLEASPTPGSSNLSDTGSESDFSQPYQEPGYEGTIDYRIRQLSYSSLLTLHSCPRKFELSRKRTTYKAEQSTKSTVTFSFGHVVGEGIQLLLEGKSLEEVLFKTFLGWYADFFDEDEKAKKSFAYACISLMKLDGMMKAGYLKDYELVYYEGKPACELSFVINFPDGFRYRGFVDAVLRNKISGEVIVLECKTTGTKYLAPAMYKNSAQAIGYSIVLDAIFPELSAYSVLYLVYQTGSQEYTQFSFAKTYLQRALWIRELLLDIDIIKMYESAGVYPQHGESCLSFGRDCEYFQTCNLSTDFLAKPCTEAEVDKTDYQISITFEQLLDSQLEKST